MEIVPLPGRAKRIKTQSAEYSACEEEQNFVQGFGGET
jgi:hypothetical protein